MSMCLKRSLALGLFLSMAFFLWGRPTLSLVVEEGVYKGIKTSLETWKADVGKEGFAILEHVVSSALSPVQLRELLQADHERSSIEGAFLIGNLPLAFFEESLDGKVPYVVEYYFMELSGQWQDADDDGWFDAFTDGNGVPEIYLGRLKADNAGISELKAYTEYFTRNHAYRSLASGYPRKTFTMAAEDVPTLYRTGTLYGLANHQDIALRNSEEFLKQLANNSAELLLVSAHSDARGHAFPEKAVTSFDLAQTKKDYGFVIMNNCSAGDIATSLNLMTAYLFHQSRALLCFAVTKSASHHYFNKYFISDYLSRIPVIGRALLTFNRDYARGLIGSDECEFYIFGDPSLSLSMHIDPSYQDFEAESARKGSHIFDNSYTYSPQEFFRLGAYYDIRYHSFHPERRGTYGSWFLSSKRPWGDLNADIHASRGQDDAVSFSFYGRILEFYSETDPGHGQLAVSVDGVADGTIDFSAPRKGQVLLYRKEWPENGRHQISLRGLSSGAWFVVDYFKVFVQ